ncbi:MAG: peptidase S10 [Bacteroidetes bacterium]|nr:peptidase S10 [Bacteroidota bacterium]
MIQKTLKNKLLLTISCLFISLPVFYGQVVSPKKFVTQHGWKNGSKTVLYKAVGSETPLTNKDGDTTALLWTVSYLKANADNKQPVSFVFNGGPGSASVWLHMGFLGPKVVRVDSEANQDDGAAPYEWTENPDFLIEQTDLVFIDPVGTGYSRVVGKGKVEDYWGLNEDAASIAQFIRRWLTENGRWLSPKYIIGESFGTTRAAAIAETLEGDGQEVALNGLVLISQALDYAGSTSIDDNIVSYVTYLPSMAATSWYHKKAGVGKTLESFVEEARQFAYNEYVSALYKGNLLKPAEKEKLVQKLVYFTGLSENYIRLSNCRILIPRYQKELLRDAGLTLGRLDGRFKGSEADNISGRPTLGDASGYQTSGAYTAFFNHYLKQDLNVEQSIPYLSDNDNIGNLWNWRDVPVGQYWEPVPVNVTRRLTAAMRRNSDLKVLVAAGYYDLITPFFDAEYTFSRNGIPSDRVQFQYYEAGHMMYNHQPDFKKLADDIKIFLAK